MRFSQHGHYMLYQCSSWSGDSGCAIVLQDGLLVGLHTDGVNQAKEMLDRKKSVDERLTDLEGSVESLIKSTASGGIATVLCSREVLASIDSLAAVAIGSCE